MMLGEITKNHPLADMLQTQVDSLRKLDTERLREELGKAFKITVEQIVRISAIVRVLEDRGENLDDLKYSLLGYLRKVAYGQILPDVLVKYQGAPLLLSRVAALPIPDQQRVLSGKPLRVMILDNGKTDARLCEPLKMSGPEIRQVFARDHIRDDGEQVSWIRARPSRPVNSAGTGIEVDAKRKGIIVSGEHVFISRTELVNFLARVTD